MTDYHLPGIAAALPIMTTSTQAPLTGARDDVTSSE